MAALSRARGHTMRDIVATIQAEQDEAIRAPWQGFTMISGGPGHRARRSSPCTGPRSCSTRNRRRFEYGGVLVVGPEPGVHELHRAGAALPRRGRGDAALDRRGRRRRGRSSAASAWTRRRGRDHQGQPADGRRAEAAGARAVAGGAAGAVRSPCRATCCGWTPTSSPGSGPTSSPTTSSTQGRERRREGPAQRALAQTPRDIDLERDEFDERVADTAAFAMFSQRLVAAASARPTRWPGWPTRP